MPVSRRGFLVGSAAALGCGTAQGAAMPVRTDDFDYVVAGGGFAGVAAALAGAREGLRTCLLERTAALGGLSTIGHVVVFMPLCDGFGRQVTFGLAEEIMLLATRHSAARPNGPWADKRGKSEAELAKDRYELNFDSGAMMLGLEQALGEAGVTVFYDMAVTGVERDAAGAVSAVVASFGGESRRFAARTFTDATGDATLARLCGEPTVAGEGNPVGGWYYAVDGERRVTLRCGAGARYRQNHPDALVFSGADAESRTRHLVLSHRAMLEDLAAENRERAKSGRSPLGVFSVPSYSTLLRQRRIDGAYVMDGATVHRWCADAVGVFSDWRKPGPVWAMPYRALLPRRTTNLTVAGRCLSSAGDLWDVTRCLPACCVSGQAAGVAAALQVRASCAARDVAVRDLQKALVAKGVRLDPALVRPHANYRPAAAVQLRTEGF